MKIHPRKGIPIICIALLLVNMMLTSVSATDNESKIGNNISDMPECDNWVKPMDLSEFNGNKTQIKKEPLSPEELEKTDPFIIALNESEKKRLNSIAKGSINLEADFEIDGIITEGETVDDSNFSVSMTEAVEIAGNQLNSTISPQDVRIVFSGSEPFWAVTYMDGPTATTYFIDTENGDFYYYLSEATDRTDRNISKTIEGFIAASIIGILLMLILGMRKKT
ncbi:MAG: hypothetical protein PWQ44_1713 [Methanolobus sp.]|jgi:hypothetical protein|nr:hypothetical protein [Methanolobus sp.]